MTPKPDLVSVPRNPTESQLRAACEAVVLLKPEAKLDLVRVIYQAMLAAAPGEGLGALPTVATPINEEPPND